jgi:DNA-binding NarL/FixJ family response regulator
MTAGALTQRRDLSAARTFGKKVLVVDARPLVRWALAQMINESDDLSLAGETSNSADTLSAIFALVPDLVVIDGSSLDEAGWELVRVIRQRYPNIGIVLISAAESDTSLLRALDSGASAYLANTASVEDIMAALRHAAVLPSSFSAAGLAEALRRRAERINKMPLSSRELQVLSLLRDGKSVPEVAATLYVSLSTAKTYVARLYEKLGANNRAQALMAAVDRGLFEARPVSAIAV